MEPHGFVYRNTHGDEAVITYNIKTGNMFGRMSTHEDKHYFIEKCHYGHVIKEYDLSSFEELEMGDDERGGGRSMDPVMETEDRVEDTTTIVTYSVMFYYTQAFEDGTPNIDEFLDQVISVANAGYKNSQIPIRAQKFCSEKATIDEIDGNGPMLRAFWKMKDDDESTSNLRNSADIAFLLTNARGHGHSGAAYYPWSYRKVGFCLKSRAIEDFTFAHEIGHTMGAAHNREQDINPKHPEGQGHLIDQVRFPLIQMVDNNEEIFQPFSC